MLLEKIVLLAIVFSSLPFAFSESTYTQEESLIMVPFDYSGHSCWLESETLYQCEWQGEIDPFTIEDLEQFKHALSEEVYAEKLAEIEAINNPVIEEPVLTPLEVKIMKLEEKLVNGEAKTEDSVLFHLLTQLDECKQGLDSRTLHFQNARTFTISEFENWNKNHVKVEHEIGVLALAMEECKSQQILFKDSAGYENMIGGEEDIQYSLLTEYEGVQALDFELYNKNSHRIDMNGICNNNQYSQANKEMMGCEKQVYEGAMYTNPSKVINYYSPAYTEYVKFMNGYGNILATSEDKVNAEKIAEPVLKEMLEENIWYNRE
mgnify:CR=1 FL=1